MVATGSLPAIVGAAHERIEESRSIASELDLPMLGAYLADAERTFALELAAARGEWTSLTPAAGACRADRPEGHGHGRGVSLLRPHLPRELGDASRGNARARRRSHPASPPASSWRSCARAGTTSASRSTNSSPATVANGFRYYDHPWSDADADTVGVFLRLLPHRTRPAEHAAALDAVLACLDRLTRELGAIPVWITDCDAPGIGADAGRPPTMTLGESCGTVMAHALLGLLSAGFEAHRETIGTGAGHLMRRIGESGLGRQRELPADVRARRIPSDC